MGAGTIKEAMAIMKQRTQAPQVEDLTFEDVYDSESEAMDWLVPGLLPVGETVLLCALPKVGKSKLAMIWRFQWLQENLAFWGKKLSKARYC